MSNMGHSPDPRWSYADAVAGNVRAQAGRQRMTQAKLSRLTGISAGTLSRKWLGRYPFDVAELEAIAKALEVSVGSLVAPPAQGGNGPATRDSSGRRQSLISVGA